jgi:O-antigen/teichoic acid export membrane protein
MAEIVNKSLFKVATGTTIVLVGTFIGMLLTFVGKVIIIRYITQTEYGILSLALVLLNIFVIVSAMGVQEGSTRYIAHFRAKGDRSKVKGVMLSSIQITLVSSVFIAILLFLSSDFISNFFHTNELSTPLKIFSICIPFATLTGTFLSLFRGFDRVDAKVYFGDISGNVFFLLSLGIVFLFGLSFLGVIYANLAAIILNFIVVVIYAVKELPIKGTENVNIPRVRKELLLFSIPLLTTVMLGMILAWTDTLMLGYFKTPIDVALYNSAMPIAKLIGLPLASMLFLYIPITSQLYTQNLMPEIKRNYAILTKWIFAATLPVFLIFFLFPKTVLDFFFGSNYVQASVALKILVFGIFIHTFFGPNGATLIAVGKVRILMWTALSGAILNVFLNLSLIPPFGITGAAISSALALCAVNILLAAKLFRLSGVHPFTKTLLKSGIASIILIFIFYLVSKNLLTVTFWMLPLLFILFIVIYGLSLLLTKSLDNEDIVILLEIEKKMGINLKTIKKILKKFM